VSGGGGWEEEEEEGSIRFSNLGGRLYLNSGTGRWFRAPAMARLISNRIRCYIAHSPNGSLSPPPPSSSSDYDRRGDWTAGTTIGADYVTHRRTRCRSLSRSFLRRLLLPPRELSSDDEDDRVVDSSLFTFSFDFSLPWRRNRKKPGRVRDRLRPRGRHRTRTGSNKKTRRTLGG